MTGARKPADCATLTKRASQGRPEGLPRGCAFTPREETPCPKAREAEPASRTRSQIMSVFWRGPTDSRWTVCLCGDTGGRPWLCFPGNEGFLRQDALLLVDDDLGEQANKGLADNDGAHAARLLGEDSQEARAKQLVVANGAVLAQELVEHVGQVAEAERVAAKDTEKGSEPASGA